MYLFPFEFSDFIVKKTMVFINIASYRKQHDFLVYFIRRTIIKSTEVFVFFDITKMSFCLNGTDLTIQNSFFAFYICMGFRLQFFPYCSTSLCASILICSTTDSGPTIRAPSPKAITHAKNCLLTATFTFT